MSHRSPEDQEVGQTRVDLGEDLLEATRVLEKGSRSTEGLTPDARSEEELQSARILIVEGLIDQAKQCLHLSIGLNPSNLMARKLLEEIQQKEFHALLSGADTPNKGTPIDEDVDEIIRKLDEDWALGMDSSRGSGDSMLISLNSYSELASAVSRQASDLSLQERVDLAIGFLQMEMAEISVSILEPESALPSVYLGIYCWGLLQARRAFDCISVIGSRLRDQEIQGEVRRELEYLLACAREQMGEIHLARELFALLGDYRDALDRVRKLNLKLGLR